MSTTPIPIRPYPMTVFMTHPSSTTALSRATRYAPSPSLIGLADTDEILRLLRAISDLGAGHLGSRS
jgi:hypothetical protein